MKWTQQYEGPYLVLEMLSPLVAKIQQSSRTKPKIVHIDKLKKYEGEEPRMWSTAEVAAATQQDREREGATGPYIPSSSASERSTENVAIGNANQNSPVMDPDTTGRPGCVEQGAPDATVATTVADAEQEIRTGQQYNQTSSSHVEPEMEIKEEAEVELENGAGSVADFSEIQEDSNSPLESREEHRDKNEVREALPDARLDHPTLTEEVQFDNEDDSNFRHSIGHGSVEPIEDFEKSEEWSNGRQRPTQAMRRPTRFRDNEFETQFRPEERRKRCNQLGRGDQARGNADKFYNCYKYRKKKEQYNHLGREISRVLPGG